MKEEQTIHAPAFDDRFIAFAENRLQNWMESQDPLAPVNLAELSKAVILCQRLRKMRQQQASVPDHSQTTATLPGRPKPTADFISVPSPAQSSLCQFSQSSPVSSSQVSSFPAASQIQSTHPPQASPQPCSILSSFPDIDPALLNRDPKELLKEAEAMLRSLRPNRKNRHGHQHPQSLPAAVSPNSLQSGSPHASLVQSLLRKSA